MSTTGKDPIGKAILDYAATGISKDIIVHSEICDDDVIPSGYLFRTFEEMPEMEQIAIANCEGSVLDVGAGSGCHARVLHEKGYAVQAIDISPGAVQHMQTSGLNAQCKRFEEVDEQFDTILLLMNGIGIAGSLDNLEHTLLHAKTLLNKNGKIICDSSDIKYLYEDDDGSVWVDLSAAYYGNFRFQMEYEDERSEWFPWLYVDETSFSEVADKVGLELNVLYRNDHEYLAELKIAE